MAGSMTDVMEAKILNYIFRNTSPALPASNFYVGLFSVAPTDSAAGTELSGSNYARVAVDRTGTGFNAATGTSPSLTDNAGAITFPTSSGAQGTAVAVGLFDASSGGNLLYWADLAAPKPIGNGDTASFAAGALDFTQD